VIYKSISSERSIVAELQDEDLARLDRIRWCPVQFQAYVPGDDVRVHTIGDQAFATRVTTSATDYRYARRQTGEDAEFGPFELGDELSQRSIALGASLGIDMVGIDARLTPDGRSLLLRGQPKPGVLVLRGADRPGDGGGSRRIPHGSWPMPHRERERGRAVVCDLLDRAGDLGGTHVSRQESRTARNPRDRFEWWLPTVRSTASRPIRFFAQASRS
jgi:hypothetical protein